MLIVTHSLQHTNTCAHAFLQILVDHGSEVRVGDDLVMIEAMKMRNAIKATRAGIIDQIIAKKGDIVTADQPLIKFW